MTAASPPEVARQRVPTSRGDAEVRILPGEGAQAHGTLLLGHGAGGLRDAADVLALTALTADGWTVVLVDQPWKVAGRTVATPPPTLDEAWLQVLEALGEGSAPDGTPLPRPWVLGGRSAGARVACRTAVGDGGASRAAGVVALAFPLHPPGRPERPRAHELAEPVAAAVPTLVVQGERDPMGTPEEIAHAVSGPALTLHTVPGNHSPSRDLVAVVGHVRAHLEALR